PRQHGNYTCQTFEFKQVQFSDLLWRAGAGDDLIGGAGDVGRRVFRVEDGDEQNATAGAGDHGPGPTNERGVLSLNLNSGLQIKICLDQSVPILHATRGLLQFGDAIARRHAAQDAVDNHVVFVRRVVGPIDFVPDYVEISGVLLG